MNAFYNQSIELINNLSEDKITEAYDYLSFLNSKEEWESTKELESLEILGEIRKGINEINSGNFVNFKDIKRNV